MDDKVPEGTGKRKIHMKYAALFAMVLGLSAVAMAEDVTGYVVDKNCAGKPAMKTNAACSERCVKGGSPAMLVTEEGKVYAMAPQDKVTSFAGKKVTVTGKVDGESITVESIK